MSTTSDGGGDSVAPANCCVCGQEFAAGELKRASVPPIAALAGCDVDMDDPEPMPAVIDSNWYCASCRIRVNVRRACLIFGQMG